MSPRSLFGELGARRVSPVLLLLVILSFFLVFAGVSCNPTTTRAAISSIDATQGVTGAQAAQVNACVNALGSTNILTYSGWQIAFGKNPVVGSVPAACNQNNAAGADTSSANIGPQLLAFLALISVFLALLTSMLGVLGLVTARSRSLVTAIFAAGAGGLLILDHFHVRDALLSKISSSEGTSIPGLDPVSLFNINAGIGLIVALVILAVTVVYNVAALLVKPVPAGVAIAIPDSPEHPPPEEPPPAEQPPP
ncbi:MAG: hypothetical protein WAW53_05985 [Candidatus Dormiibacterota bacterium]